jgi:FtsZ-binding cell division protein ZapB
MREIRLAVSTLKSNNQGLTNQQKAVLTMKRLAIEHQMNQLRTHQDENMSRLQSLKGKIQLANLSQVNIILAELIASAEARQDLIESIQLLFVEANAILQA